MAFPPPTSVCNSMLALCILSIAPPLGLFFCFVLYRDHILYWHCWGLLHHVAMMPVEPIKAVEGVWDGCITVTVLEILDLLCMSSSLLYICIYLLSFLHCQTIGFQHRSLPWFLAFLVCLIVQESSTSHGTPTSQKSTLLSTCAWMTTSGLWMSPLGTQPSWGSGTSSRFAAHMTSPPSAFPSCWCMKCQK